MRLLQKKCICLDESCRKKYTDPSSLRKHILTQHGPNELDRQRKVKKEMQPTRRGGGVRKGKQSTSPQISPNALQQWLVEVALMFINWALERRFTLCVEAKF